ncbi:MAG: cell division protein ZapB [Spirochaetes bacterium]|nr:cell division protein ZapB [Spirochaetota bacterium]MBU1081675.1 cell division protein ZapB [Spirochaetota bacterium]
MISLEQVRALESRVEKAVALIASLRSENASMRSGLAAAESRVAELEGLVADFQKDQARIEAGIVEALRKLDSFEDAVHDATDAKQAQIVAKAVSEEAPAVAADPAEAGPVPEPVMEESADASEEDGGVEAASAGAEASASQDGALDIF